ncbi:UvrD-helicase domain-containing protein [Amycolatopsis sp. NPDC057786]|uniref:UvrD-helicase domain-containing protein n=1 Tax=Amycolatopsis sp. NPDC057786 TaxID=3346250 RepID=UPI00366CB8CD
MTSLEQRRAAAREQQRRATSLPAPLFVQACPGAGKTRVIVDRHLAAAGGGRRGQAVVSFTNVACDEVTRRCREAGRPHLADFPNFVGTIDSFLWRYLVRPFLSSDRTWNRIDSWERIGATVDVWDGRRTHTLRLSDFQWTRDPGAEQCRAQFQFRTKNAAAYKTLEIWGCSTPRRNKQSGDVTHWPSRGTSPGTRHVSVHYVDCANSGAT